MIIADDGCVKIGSVLLPGLFKSIDISGKAMVEELEVKGKGKKPKQATGYEDHTISIELVLMDDDREGGKTKEEKLTILQNLFKSKGQKIPKVYNMVNKHTSQRGIDKVLFDSLNTKETNKRDEITASLKFIEYESISISAKKNTTDKKTKKKDIPTSQGVGNEYKEYLQSRGEAPKRQDKTSKSPALDVPVPQIK